MNTGIFIALFNPSIAFVLASAFLLFWLQQRTRAYMATLAAGYAGMGIGFLLQYFELPIGFYPTKFLSNLFFLVSCVLVGSAVLRRYNRPVPWIALAVLAGGGLAGLAWFMAVDPSLTWRIYVMNFALGGISLLVAVELRAVPEKAALDKVIFVAALLTGLNFVVRTLVLVHLHGGYDSYAGLYSSPYWTSAMLTHALLSLVLALCLIMAAVSDMVAALRVESHTDPLSGLLNRRGFEERAHLLVTAAASGSTPASLILADLDHFKAVNDAHGHAVGDMVIRAFSTLLREAGSDRAVIGRTGGEEFAFVLPACDIVMAKLVAEGLRTALSEGRLHGVPGQVGKVTASFGVATLGKGETLTALFARADAALYQAKRDGRNLVRQATTGKAGKALASSGEGQSGLASKKAATPTRRRLR